MAFARRTNCYICDIRGNERQMGRIDGVELQEIARIRRNENELPAQDIGENTRMCFGCRRSVMREIELRANPYALRFNLAIVPPNNSCIFCNGDDELHVLSIECKVEAYLYCEILIPENGVRSCPVHLDGRGFILRPHFELLTCRNRLYIITPEYLERFLRAVRRVSRSKWLFEGDFILDDDELRCLTSLSNAQFDELYTYCDRVPHDRGHYTVKRKDLLMFMCKLRQGLSDKFLAIIFKYSCRRYTSSIVSFVRQSLMIRFVPENIGLNAITREEYIRLHVPDFHQQLYNPDNRNNPVAIVYCDGTYTYCFKSSNFQILRQTFCQHKGRHLIKPAILCSPTGYILDIHGPSFSDSQNNDAAMLENQLNIDEDIANWFHERDIFIVDRGYRDVIPLLEELGFDCRMPPLLEAGQNQLNTEDANESRKITKTRWIVEARNGHFKSIFKYLDKVQQIHVLENIGDYYRIAGAIINRFRVDIHMEGANAELAEIINQRATMENTVMNRVRNENLFARNAQRWIRLDAGQLEDFPILTMEYLKDLTVGIYQLNLAPSYVQDKLRRDANEEFQVEVLDNEDVVPNPGLLRVRVYSRFRNQTRHQLFIEYLPNGDVNDPDNRPITGYYCTCYCGSRTLGTCAHITSVLWYLGYARHQNDVRYPSDRLLNVIDDAGQRHPGAMP